MTHDRTRPPSDEIMARVVGEWKGWKRPKRVTDLFSGDMLDRWLDSFSGDPYIDCPRADTDAALELLGWLEMTDRASFQSDVYESEIAEEAQGPCWEVTSYMGVSMIPLSGQPFRTAICWLAVDVMGVNTN